MFKRFTTLFTIFCLLLLSWSCTSIQLERVGKVKAKIDSRPAHSYQPNIYRVITVSNEIIEFSKKNPGIIVGDVVMGEQVIGKGVFKTVSIPLAEIEMVAIKKFNGEKTFLLLVSSPVLIGIIGFVSMLIYSGLGGEMF